MAAFWTQVSSGWGLDDRKRSLAYSKRAFLHMIIQLEVNSSRVTYFRDLKEHSDRWFSLCIDRLSGSSILYASQILGSTTFAGITSLQLVGTERWNIRFKDNFLEEWAFPALASLEIDGDSVALRSVTRLTSLKIRFPRNAHGMGLTTLARALRSVPLLQELEVEIDRSMFEVEPGAAELPHLKRLAVCESLTTKTSEEGEMMVCGSAWFTRTLKTPTLSSLTLTYQSVSGIPMDDDFQLFPSDVDLRYVDYARLSVLNCADNEHQACRLLADAILRRLPHVKKVELDLPVYAPLAHYIRESPSIRFLSMHCSSPLVDAKFLDFIQWIKRGEHELHSFYLLRWVASSKKLVTRWEGYVGCTRVKWEDLIA